MTGHPYTIGSMAVQFRPIDYVREASQQTDLSAFRILGTLYLLHVAVSRPDLWVMTLKVESQWHHVKADRRRTSGPLYLPDFPTDCAKFQQSH